uniref:Large ribosomal subunit protein eL18 n=1 Tax=Megaselia scalaris TaxID=36166 RepID=T1H752_MEGSC
GIDMWHKYDRKFRRTEPNFQYVYMRLYRFLQDRTNKNINRIVLKRLFMRKTNRPPMYLRVARFLKEVKRVTVLVVRTVTGDIRLLQVPKMTLCALHVTDRVRQHMIKAGGKVLPPSKKTLLIQGKRNASVAHKHFGKVPGVPHSNTRTNVCSKGRKIERASG